MIIEANMRSHRWTRPNGTRCSFEPDRNEPQVVVGRQRLDSRTRALRNPVEVVLLNLDELTEKRFISEVLEIADQLVFRLEQEEIVVDLQRDGVSFRTLGVKP
jgi:hypothetical protein